MKKIVIVILTLIFITGCGNKANGNSQSQSYSFNYNGKEYTINNVFTINEYGNANNYSEIPSCAFDGIDKVYTYDNFEIITYQDGDKERIYSIYFLNNSIYTKEGLKIDDSIDKMKELYGTDYENVDNLYKYKKNDVSLNIIIENEKVVSIEYTYLVN